MPIKLIMPFQFCIYFIIQVFGLFFLKLIYKTNWSAVFSKCTFHVLCLVFPDHDVELTADERLEKWSRGLSTAGWLHCVCQQYTTNAQHTQTCLLDYASDES